MDLVFIHMGVKDIPNYFWETIKQASKLHSGYINLITPNKYVYNVRNYGNIRFFSVESLIDDKNKEFERLSKFMLEYCLQDFWVVTMQRFFILESFMRKYPMINSLVHLEYDNPIYTDFNKLKRVFKEKYKDSIGICPINSDHNSAGIMYVDNLRSIEWLNNKTLEHLELGKDELNKRYGMVTEMRLLKTFYDGINLKYLPTLPNDGEYSNNIEHFNSIFDGATWGQYIGGIYNAFNGSRKTPMSNESICTNHKIGEELVKNRFNIYWQEEKSGKIPYVKDNNSGKVYRFNNLHIHSKRINEYV